MTCLNLCIWPCFADWFIQSIKVLLEQGPSSYKYLKFVGQLTPSLGNIYIYPKHRVTQRLAFVSLDLGG